MGLGRGKRVAEGGRLIVPPHPPASRLILLELKSETLMGFSPGREKGLIDEIPAGPARASRGSFGSIPDQGYGNESQIGRECRKVVFSQILSWASISLTLEPSVLWRVYHLMMPTSGRRSPLYYCSFSRGLAALAMRPEIFETDRTLQSSRTDTSYHKANKGIYPRNYNPKRAGSKNHAFFTKSSARRHVTRPHYPIPLSRPQRGSSTHSCCSNPVSPQKSSSQPFSLGYLPR